MMARTPAMMILRVPTSRRNSSTYPMPRSLPDRAARPWYAGAAEPTGLAAIGLGGVAGVSLDERAAIRDLVRRLGETGQPATPAELARLRDFFAHQVLPAGVTTRVRAKHDLHVVTRAEWPSDTTEEEYLESLRSTVEDWRSGIFLAWDELEGRWTVCFVGRVRRAWRGHRAGSRLVVLFNGERLFWITGF